MLNISSSELTLISMENTTDVPEEEPDDNGREITSMIQIVMRPLLIVFGTTGNVLLFLVMRRGSLKTVSTCFYMSILALADTGRFILIHFMARTTPLFFTDLFSLPCRSRVDQLSIF